MLHHKNILLIVGGGIAAYKALELIRRLRAQGAGVRVILTHAATQFVTPLSASSLSGEKVYTDLFSLTDEAEIGHIRLSREADLLLVVPATADLMAKMATGQADDLASTVLLATDKPILLAPSMNVKMWEHPATKRNVVALRGDGVSIVHPVEGEMACGEYGCGRLAEIPDILSAAERLIGGAPMTMATGLLKGKHVVVTAGPTHEPIDSVRYIANRSSGKQGYAIAEAAHAAGARVTLISGPTNLAAPANIDVVPVTTALEMREAAFSALPADIFIATAAVADWRPKRAITGKLKKTAASAPELVLTENPDILAEISRSDARPGLVVGFAAETDDLLKHAASKLAKKGCDFIVANDVSEGTNVMGGDENTVHFLSAHGVESWAKSSKTDVARRLIERCVKALIEKRG